MGWWWCAGGSQAGGGSRGAGSCEDFHCQCQRGSKDEGLSYGCVMVHGERARKQVAGETAGSGARVGSTSCEA